MDISICKAQPTVDPAPSVTIQIAEEIPDFNIIQLQDAFCTEQARKLEKALYNSLPGGTYDRLLGLMLAHKATHFRVSHWEIPA